MSGISRRVIFAGQIPVTRGEKNGTKVYRFLDTAMVITALGHCLEPFSFPGTHYVTDTMPANYDPTDDMRRIDEIQSYVSPGVNQDLFAEGGEILHAYNQWFEVYR